MCESIGSIAFEPTRSLAGSHVSSGNCMPSNHHASLAEGFGRASRPRIVPEQRELPSSPQDKNDRITRAASTECLLPLPATKEWGEGRGEERTCKHCTKPTLPGSRHPSPWPSPRFAGRGYSRRLVAYPTVSSVILFATRRVRNCELVA